LDFSVLRQDFGLPQSEFLYYLQLKSCLKKVPNLTPGPLQTSLIVELFQRVRNKKGKVSQIYAMLLNKASPDRTPSKLQWEKNLGHSISEKGWEEALSSLITAGMDLWLRLIQYKIVNRLYWLLSRLAKLGLRDSDLCWRCSKASGSLSHMLWSCEMIRPFWDAVIDRIRNCLGYPLPTDPINCILGIDLHHGNTSKMAVRFVKLALTTAKCLVMKYWRQEISPTFKEWGLLMTDTASQEHVIMKVGGKLEQFTRFGPSFWTGLPLPQALLKIGLS
uniref:Reverse transcriptase zinc-binding domain-containing protein n=1 Tax=Latimeria chalumnae TaxID=7897 RepID=H3AM40_LATCH